MAPEPAAALAVVPTTSPNSRIGLMFGGGRIPIGELDHQEILDLLKIMGLAVADYTFELAAARRRVNRTRAANAKTSSHNFVPRPIKAPVDPVNVILGWREPNRPSDNVRVWTYLVLLGEGRWLLYEQYIRQPQSDPGLMMQVRELTSSFTQSFFVDHRMTLVDLVEDTVVRLIGLLEDIAARSGRRSRAWRQDLQKTLDWLAEVARRLQIDPTPSQGVGD